MQPIIVAEHLSKTYKSGKIEVPALRGVTFSIDPGEFVSVVGPSGSGKSTLFYILGGLARASSGSLFIDGIDFVALNDAERTRMRKARIGFVFQKFNLLPTLTARGNIQIGYDIAERPEPLDPAYLDHLTDLLGIKGRLDHRPSELSGGEQQRVAIARALITRPAIILADEPTGNLDTRNSEAVLEMLRFSNREFNQTVLMITHNEEAAAIGDRILHMRGRRDDWRRGWGGAGLSTPRVISQLCSDFSDIREASMPSMPLKSVPASPSRYRGTLADLTEKHLCSVMPEPSWVESFHRHLKAYCAQEAPLLLLRYRKPAERCTDLLTENGTVVRWTDNSPAWEIHHAAFQCLTWSAIEFDSFVRAIPCKMFAAKNNSINKAKWYVAHIFPVKEDRRRAGEMTHTEQIARFMRNVHPANHFYFPSPTRRIGRLYGESRQVIQYMAAYYRKRYAAIWSEFLQFAMAEDSPLKLDESANFHIDFRSGAAGIEVAKASVVGVALKATMRDNGGESANEISGRPSALRAREFDSLWEEFLHRRDVGDVANSLEARDKLAGAHSLFERTLKAAHPDWPPTPGKQETSMITRINRFPGVEAVVGTVTLRNKDELIAAVLLRNKTVHSTDAVTVTEAKAAARVLIEAAGSILKALGGSVEKPLTGGPKTGTNNHCELLVGDCGRGDLNWVGNDTSQRNQSGVVRENAISVILRLCWRRSSDSPERFIGCYRLDLAGLESSGFVRKEAKSGKYRVRIVHASDNNLYLQLNSKDPRIPLGRFV